MEQQFRVSILFCKIILLLKILFKIKSKESSSLGLFRLRLRVNKYNRGEEELAAPEGHLHVGFSLTHEGETTLVCNALASPILFPFGTVRHTDFKTSK